jgi:Ni/Fe-hydrogenase subunit HybB-like protein
MKRLNWLKSLLWATFAAGFVAIVLRVFAGLGATTHLSNFVSWGIWNAIKFSIVPLSGGAFVMAATVYIFGLERFHKLLRLCILTGFLGYSTFATMLFFDIGLPYRIWHPIIYWQHHSVLFEVAICVMSYLTVLALEFTPTALEHRLFARPLFQKIFKLLKSVTIPLVIAGIVLSTLHQSSLGALFLIIPHRLHQLWYSPLVPVLFLTSAVGMGLLVVAVEAFFLEYFLETKAPTDILAPLARAGAGVMILFTVIRIGDQLHRNVLAGAGGGMALMYMLESLLLTGIPALLLISRVRNSRPGLFWCSLSAMAGVVLYRCNVSLLAIDWGQASYVPAWTELMVMFGILSGSFLVFLFLVENLDIYGSGDELEKRNIAEGAIATIRPASNAWVGGAWVDAPRRYSLIAVIAASAAVALLADNVFWGSDSAQSPVLKSRTVKGVSVERSAGPGHEFRFVELEEAAPVDVQSLDLLMIDGNRDGRFVLFPHESHKRELGGENSCEKCHHQRMPFDENTSCHECHRDMYETTDIFDHAFHIEKLQGDPGCVECHADDSTVKTRKMATACSKCHTNILVNGSRVETPEGGTMGLAPGYLDAMHELCIECHRERIAEEPQLCGDAFARCDGCHGIMDGTDLMEFEPYAQSFLISATRKDSNVIKGHQKMGSYRGL